MNRDRSFRTSPPDQLAPSRFKDTGTLKTNMVDGWSCNPPRRLVSRRMNWGEILKICVRRIWVAGERKSKRKSSGVNPLLHGLLPGRDEGDRRRSQVLPLKDERSRERPFSRVAGADWIFEDIGCCSIKALTGAKNVIVIVALPEIAYPQGAGTSSSGALECANRFCEIR